MRSSSLTLAVFLWSAVVGGQTTRAALDAPILPKEAAVSGPESVTGPGHASAPVAMGIVRTTVEVNAHTAGVGDVQTGPQPFHASAGEIMGSAGTFGDFSRYLQLFPGVVFNTDTSDDLLVRGGNPIENLFLVDGFEIPNINHIASEGTTGGLVSMIDTSAVQNLDLYTGGYDARYDERLSSVVDIHTRERGDQESHANAEFGFVGAGGLALMPLPGGGSLLASAHRSMLNLFTNDIGLNGVPIYSNILLSARVNLSAKERSGLFLDAARGCVRSVPPESAKLPERAARNGAVPGFRRSVFLLRQGIDGGKKRQGRSGVVPGPWRSRRLRG